jgi:protein-S-isoprenylcysteine O-methyltransferase Ste14
MRDGEGGTVFGVGGGVKEGRKNRMEQSEQKAQEAKSAGHVVSQVLFNGVAVVAALVVIVPVALLPLTDSFAWRATGVALFVAASVERIWSMYLRAGLGCAKAGAGRDWTAIAVGYAYALTLGGAMAEFFVHRGFPSAAWVVVGAAVYLAGVALRYWALHVLRHQWHIDVSDAGDRRFLVRKGPYGLMRHPLYLGACLEIVGLPVFLGGGWALLFGALVFIPLEVKRAYFEERFLFDLFGDEYRQYRREVWGFFPLPFSPRG